MYSATAMAWHPDGTALSIGTSTGAIDLYDACKERLAYGQDFELAYGFDGGATLTHLTHGDTLSPERVDSPERCSFKCFWCLSYTAAIS